MSQENTYRPAVSPSEAVMIPATEPAGVGAESPAAQGAQAAQIPARSNASLALEALRNRARRFDATRMQWMQAPIDAPAVGAPGQSTVPSRTGLAETGGNTRRRTNLQGAALSTLMRSAARRYTPPPTLRVPTAPIAPQPPMRGALRTVVRQAVNRNPTAPQSTPQPAAAPQSAPQPTAAPQPVASVRPANPVKA